MSVNLSGQLPKDERNGIGAISAALCDDPEATHVIVCMVDCRRITTDTDTGDVIPTARIVAVEAFPGTTADAKGLERMIARRFEQRTGKAELPLDPGEVLRHGSGVLLSDRSGDDDSGGES